MDLKDAVLSTLAELEDFEDDFQAQSKTINKPQNQIREQEVQEPKIITQEIQEVILETFSAPKSKDENMQKFLLSLRERILVLFEGLQTINNSKNSETLNLEKKLDLTINFLEFLLASIEDKIEVAPE